MELQFFPTPPELAKRLWELFNPDFPIEQFMTNWQV